MISNIAGARSTEPKGPPSLAAEAEPPFPHAAVASAAVAILVILSIVAYLDRQILSLMIPLIKSEFDVSDSQMGLLQGAAFSLVYSLAAFPLGYAVDRYSRRVVLFVGVFCWALSATACGLAFSFNTLLAARIGVGLGEAALHPVVSSMLSDLFPKKRLSTAFAVVSVGASIGTQGALIIGGAVLHWASDGWTMPFLGHLPAWKVAFIVTGVPGLFLAFAIFLIPEPKRRLSKSAPREGESTWSDVYPFLVQHRRFLSCYIGGFSALAVASTAMMTWGPTVLQRVYQMTPGATGFVLGTYALASGMIGTMGSGLIVDRLYSAGRANAHAIFYSLAGLMIIVVGLASAFASSPWIYLLILLPSKLVSNFTGVGTAGVQLITPSHLRGRMAALFAFCVILCGSTVGPSAVAFFTDIVFEDEFKVHWSVGVTMATFGLLGTMLLATAARITRSVETQSA